jgi:uncharacterized protein (DUF433 family)
MSNETAPSKARSGGATPTGIVPSPAATHPSRRGDCAPARLVFSQPNCARADSRSPGRLSREEFIAIAAPILATPEERPGDAVRRIEAATGMAAGAIYSRLRLYGLQLQREDRKAEILRLYRAGWQPAQIAARYGVDVRTIYAYASAARRSGRAVPRAPGVGPERRMNYADVARRWNAGEKQAAIAAVYGVTQNAVSNAVRAMAKDGMITRPLGRWPRGGA